MYLTRGGIYLETDNIKPYKDKYTFSRYEGFGPHSKLVHYPYYKKMGRGVVVPRSLPIDAKHLTNLVKSPDIEINCSATFTPNQEVVINSIYDLFMLYLKLDGMPKRTGKTIVMDTGLGKTYLAIGLIHKFKKRALYVVYDEKALLSATRELRKTLDVKTTCYYGKKKDASGDVVVMIVNSVLNQPLEFFKKFGTVIYDEIPDYVTQLRLEMFFKTNTMFNIGLTATPYKGGLERIYIDMVGDLLFATKIKGFNVEEIKFEGEVRKVKHTVKDVKYRDGHVDFIATIKALVDDADRTNLVLKHIKQLRAEGKSVYIFADLKAYSDHIYFKCNGLGKKVILRGGACNEDYDDAANADLIFTTYKFGEKCLSIGHMDALLYLTPRRDANQSSGRIVRRDGDPLSARVIVDIVDSCFAKQFTVRRKAYISREFTIISV